MRKRLQLATLLLSVFISSAYSGENLKNCVPVAEWSGVLNFDETNRQADGSVFITLENAPQQYSDLIGSKINLKFGNNGSVDAQWFEQQNMNVTFGRRALERGTTDILLALRLDGLQNVSALESLAASRDNDKVRVELRGAIQVLNQKIIINKEPILIEGVEKCLVKFVSTDSNATANVVEWNSETRTYSGSNTEVKLDFRRHLPQYNDPNNGLEFIDFSGIENQQANTAGWNAYIERVNGKPVIRAIEPYGLFEANNSLAENASDTTSLRESRKDYWKINNEDKGKIKQISYLAEGIESYEPTLGQEFLVVHAFGSYNDHGMSLGYYRGHASFGFGKTVIHPITGDLVYEVIYKQTYAQNGTGLFAGSMHWHAFAGDLYRGRMFYRPIVDLMYPLGNLSNDIEGRNFRAELERSIDEMSIKYRVGFGTGWSMVTLLTSCVHDSGNILIEQLDKFNRFLRGKRSYRKERDLVRALKNRLGNVVLPDQMFRNPDLIPEGIDSKLSTIVQARRNLNISIPRNFQDQVYLGFMDHALEYQSAPVIAFRTVQIGDELPEISAQSPDRIGSLLQVGFDFIGERIGSIFDK